MNVPISGRDFGGLGPICKYSSGRWAFAISFCHPPTRNYQEIILQAPQGKASGDCRGGDLIGFYGRTHIFVLVTF